MNTETERPERGIREALEGLAGEAPLPRGIDSSLVGRGRRRLGAALVAALAAMSLLIYGGWLAATRLGTSNTRPAAPVACTWSVVSDDGPDPATYQTFLRDVSATSDENVWTVGTYGRPGEAQPYRTVTEHWDGTAWTLVPSPNVLGEGDSVATGSLDGIAAVASNEAWSVGGEPGGVLIEHWDGTGWGVEQAPRLVAHYSHLSGADATSPTDVWAVGGQVLYGGRGEALVEHYDGQSWSIVPSPVADPVAPTGQAFDTLLDVSARASTDVWAVGSSFDVPETASRTLAMHWDGERWQIVPTPDMPAGGPGREVIDQLWSVSSIGPKDAWAVGTHEEWDAKNGTPLSGGPLVEHWDGTTWSLVPTPATDGGLRGVVALSSDDVWAVGQAGTPGHERTLPFHWNGSIWEEAPGGEGAPGELSAAAATPSGRVWAVGTGLDASGSVAGSLVERCS